jgi:uncharacterized membrane protein YtjA (UPF0391 family)
MVVQAHSMMESREATTYPMLHYALIFVIIALVAAVLGLGGIAGTALYIAKILLFVFLVLFIVSFFFGRKPNI